MEEDLQTQLKNLKDYSERKIQTLEEDSSSSGTAARLYMSASQAINDSTPTLVNFNTQDFANGITVSTTNKSFTILTAGKYLVSAIISYSATVDAKSYAIMIYKASSAISSAWASSSGTTKQCAPNITDILDLAVGDVITIYAIQYSGGAETITNSVAGGTGQPSFFAIAKL